MSRVRASSSAMSDGMSAEKNHPLRHVYYPYVPFVDDKASSSLYESAGKVKMGACAKKRGMAELFPSYPDVYVRSVYSVSSAGRIGMAPFFVQTNADVRTAREWASGTVFPLRMLAIKAAVKESPAPTVSATSTCGVGRNDTEPGVKT